MVLETIQMVPMRPFSQKIFFFKNRKCALFFFTFQPGQLGLPEVKSATNPILISFSGLERHEKIKFIATSNRHSIAVSANDKLYCWGSNKNGRCGAGSKDRIDVPLQISLPHSGIIKKIAVGWYQNKSKIDCL